MNRGLLSFLAFLTVLLFGLLIAAYVLGPNVLAFIFEGDRNSEGVVIVSLVDFADAEHARVQVDDYEALAAPMIAAVGGRPLWRATLQDPLRGEIDGTVSSIELVGYPTRAAFIDLVTTREYRALLGARDGAALRSATFAATPVAAATEPAGQGAAAPTSGLPAGATPPADAPGAAPVADIDTSETGAYVVRLLAGARDDALATYESKWLDEDARMLQRHRGRTLWRAPLNPLAGQRDMRFDALVIYGFSDEAHRDAWAGDDERQTLQTLQRRLFKRDLLVFANAVPIVAAPSSPQGGAATPGEAPANAESSAEPASTTRTASDAPANAADAKTPGERGGDETIDAQTGAAPLDAAGDAVPD